MKLNKLIVTNVESKNSSVLIEIGDKKLKLLNDHIVQVVRNSDLVKINSFDVQVGDSIVAYDKKGGESNAPK